jgi:3',5'-cyclic AMP phosphodiesterase CpdA
VVRILQVSDTHLAPDRPQNLANWDAVVEHVRRHPPDLVVNTGDIASDAPAEPSELDFAAGHHDRLDVEVVAVPGNHDVGDHRGPDDSVRQGHRLDPSLRERYGRLFGPEWWCRDLPGCRLVGANTQLMGSGADGEQDQWDDLAGWLTGSSAPVVLFVHKPLFLDDPAVPGERFRYLQAPARDRLLALMADAPVALVASGHTHQYRRRTVGGRSYSWGPSTAFVLAPAAQPTFGLRQVGAVDITIDGSGATTRLVRPQGIVDHVLG